MADSRVERVLEAMADPRGPVVLEVMNLTSSQDAELRRALAARGWQVHPVSLEGVTSKISMLDAFAASLAFPGYFGRNWDAFLDCAADLSWLTEKRHLCAVTGGAGFASRCPDEDRMLRDVMEDVRERSREVEDPTDLRLLFF